MRCYRLVFIGSLTPHLKKSRDGLTFIAAIPAFQFWTERGISAGPGRKGRSCCQTRPGGSSDGGRERDALPCLTGTFLYVKNVRVKRKKRTSGF